MPRPTDVAFVAIDEVQLAGDLERGNIFTDRILHLRGRQETLLLGAGTMLGILEKLVGGYVSPAAAEVVAFVLLIGVLTIRPQGLFGKRETVKV